MPTHGLAACRLLKSQTIQLITSHHIETTDAGLDGLCIREINVYHTTL